MVEGNLKRPVERGLEDVTWHAISCHSIDRCRPDVYASRMSYDSLCVCTSASVLMCPLALPSCLSWPRCSPPNTNNSRAAGPCSPGPPGAFKRGLVLVPPVIHTALPGRDVGGEEGVERRGRVRRGRVWGSYLVDKYRRVLHMRLGAWRMGASLGEVCARSMEGGRWVGCDDVVCVCVWTCV